MAGSNMNRRELLELAALAASGTFSLRAGAFGESPSRSNQSAAAQNAEDRSKSKATDSSHRPPEVATLYSKEYGRRRIQKVQAAIRRANLDALIVTNRALDYIGYVSNFHPYPLEPGMALVLADGPSTLFVNTYSSAHTRALIPIVWTDAMVDVPRDLVSEGSNQNLVNACIQKLQDEKLQRGRIGVAGEEIDWLLPLYFRDRLPDAKLSDANRTLTEVIVVKDEVELALIRFGQRLIDDVAYPVFRGELRPSAMDQMVYARVLASMLENGADGYGLAVRRRSRSGLRNVGERSRTDADWKRETLFFPNPPRISLVINPKKCTTFALGRDIPESQKRGSEVIYEAYQLLMSELNLGQELTPIVQKVEAFVRSRGYEGSTVPVGHWIGT